MEESTARIAEQTGEITPKTHFTGKVMLVSLAGAKVDLGSGRVGLIHISQIKTPDGTPVKLVGDILKPGDEIEVWVKRVRKDQIELTMFEPLLYDWRDLKADMVVKGKVIRLETFGAFIDIGAEKSGLLHVSELSHGFIRNPSELLKEGDEVEVKILDVDRKKKQIKLSMKALEDEPLKEEPKLEAAEKPAKSKKTFKKSKAGKEMEESEPAVVEPTAMELAYRQAMDKEKSKNQESTRNKKDKNTSKDQEELLSRTLEQKVQTK
jgi:small subunit ribosomal protein S1